MEMSLNINFGALLKGALDADNFFPKSLFFPSSAIHRLRKGSVDQPDLISLS